MELRKVKKFLPVRPALPGSFARRRGKNFSFKAARLPVTKEKYLIKQRKKWEPRYVIRATITQAALLW